MREKVEKRSKQSGDANKETVIRTVSDHVEFVTDLVDQRGLDRNDGEDHGGGDESALKSVGFTTSFSRCPEIFWYASSAISSCLPARQSTWGRAACVSNVVILRCAEQQQFHLSNEGASNGKGQSLTAGKRGLRPVTAAGSSCGRSRRKDGAAHELGRVRAATAAVTRVRASIRKRNVLR